MIRITRHVLFWATLLFSFAANAQYYVAPSPSGNDTTGSGTLAAPWATLTKAQTAMHGGSTKFTYVRGGAYAPASIANCQGQGNTCGISMGSADNGETFSYYPPDGYGSAIITGGSTAYGNGLWDVFLINSASDITINGLTIEHFQFGGVHSPGGSSGLVVENNIIHDEYVSTQAYNSGGFTCYGCTDSSVENNVVYNMAAGGIEFAQANGDISGAVVDNNVLYNTATVYNDSGAIYFANQNSPLATNITITNNYIRDGAVAGGFGTGLGSGIYLDDCVSNVTATGNIIAGNNGSNTIDIHGGNNNVFTGNIIDLSTNAQSTLRTQTTSVGPCSYAMTGNKFENNVVISGGGGSGYNLAVAPTITNNDYYNYAGSAITDTGDASPSTQNPDFVTSNWLYSMGCSSLVLCSPVSFSPVVGGWGPPGYTIPNTGTAPSY